MLQKMLRVSRNATNVKVQNLRSLQTRSANEMSLASQTASAAYQLRVQNFTKHRNIQATQTIATV